MRHLLSLFAVLLLLAPSAEAARPLPVPKLYAVYAYADWCPNCKALSPRLDEVRSALNREDVLFVTLDLTDKPRIHQALMLAQSLGIGAFLQAQGSATGYMALLDAQKKEIGRFDSSDSTAQIKQKITAALGD